MIPISKLIGATAKGDKGDTINTKIDSSGNKNEFPKTKDPKMGVQALSQVEAVPAAPLSPLLENSASVLAADVADAQAQVQAQTQGQTQLQTDPAPSFVESEIKRLMAEQEKIMTQIRQLERTGFILLGAVEALKGVHANALALDAAAKHAENTS